MKTGIVIITFNIDTRIFLLQIEAIRKFCKDDFAIEIIDNSKDHKIAEAIQYHAERLEIQYRRTISKVKDYSMSHSFAANTSYGLLKDSYDVFFYLDHDCIPVASFSCEEILGEKLFAGIAQKKSKTYFWPGCFMFKNTIDKSIIDFSPNSEFQLDTGGNLYKLIEKYGAENAVFFSESYMQIEQLIQIAQYQNFFSIIQDTFWHCIGASNWFKVLYHETRINSFINAVTEKIKAPE